MFDLDKKNILGKADKSRKGTIDKDIVELVRLINSFDDYYTNSSCSGRITIQESFKRGETKRLLMEHSIVNFLEVKNSLKIMPKKPIWFKQEPIILHVTCRTIEDAQRLLGLARDAGLKRSGIIAIKKRIVVEIIGTERIETIIAKNGKLLVSDDCLKEFVKEANKKLKISKKKIPVLYKKIKNKLFPA